MQLVLDECVIFPTGRLAKDQQQQECTMIKQQQVIAQKERPRRAKGVLSVGDNGRGMMERPRTAHYWPWLSSRDEKRETCSSLGPGAWVV